MEIENAMQNLYGKDTKENYEQLKELEQLSIEGNTLYPYTDEFLKMLDSDQYGIRVRGFRLLCKQARWDVEHKIDREIDKILLALGDEKLTAVRQYLVALKDVVKYKKELRQKIQERLLKINYLEYKDTMQSLIFKDVEEILQLIETQNKKASE